MNIPFMTVTREIFRFPYYLLSPIIAALFWILFSVFDQNLFFNPYLVFYIPKERTLDFILSCITSILLGLVISLNICYLRNRLGVERRKECHVSLSALPAAISVFSSMCLGCSLYLSTFSLSLFGAIGVGVLSLLASYNLPIRFISLTLLIYSLYFLNKSIKNDKRGLDSTVVHETASLE
jgi:hypothetical protein